jgi:hypothetical protein
MSMNDNKQFPSKTITPTRDRLMSQSAFTTSLRDRPVVHNSQHVDDLGRKRSICSNELRRTRLDEGSLQMSNDPNSVFYRRLSETLQNQVRPDTRITDEEEKLKLFEKYDPKLVEFLKDRGGHLKSKFDKVFIT